MKTYRQLINEWQTRSQKPRLKKKKDIVVTSVSQINKKNMSKSDRGQDPKFVYALAIAQAARPGPNKRKAYWSKIANNVTKVRQLIRIRRP